jgi:hypothetical protein
MPTPRRAPSSTIKAIASLRGERILRRRGIFGTGLARHAGSPAASSDFARSQAPNAGTANGLQLGKRVAAITVNGGHADYLCVPARWLVPFPYRLDPAEAAIVVFNDLTACQMLHRTSVSAAICCLTVAEALNWLQ